MKLLSLLPCAALVIAGCTTTAPTGGGSTQTADVTPVIWKENTPVEVRRADRFACQLAALGATPSMSQQQVISLAEKADPNKTKEFVDQCMAAKGYTVTFGAICSDRDLQGGVVVGARVDDLPPLSSVKCFDGVSGFVMKA
ncbi:hypothetical protein [Oceanomicrobium pacificus]|uniref:Lipoprotein n=1 Tax=Oceanomicrobium pacificus TaxID=2692916 RepID=A0A6B0TYH1_9RHOB|nr:hypothetical protein [Oceanomicrobium pacificus]MXU66084.1 hypothetical protein [Oceanomicrobium pacificus]